MSSAVGIPPDTVIGQKYRINRKIGSGSFGEIYSGTVIYQDSNQQVAIKFEKRSARCPQLRRFSVGFYSIWPFFVLHFVEPTICNGEIEGLAILT